MTFPQPFTALVAARDFTADLLAELGDAVFEVRDDLVLAHGEIREAAWARNIWYEPRLLPATSISEAARQLSGIQRNWHLHSLEHHRRATLIQAKLPHVGAKPLHFGDPAPTAPLGSWTLWEQDQILASPCCSSPFPDGEVRFHENRIDPPSRAYLKLWEVFTRLDIQPRRGALCLDLGAAPGGWSWVLAEIGASVFSVDKAPLDPRVAARPNVEICAGSGFALDPSQIGPVDWIFSDMICYPERLLEYILRWHEVGACKNFICSLKFQGPTDHAMTARFAAIKNSKIIHLSNNKHELTWVLTSPC